MLVVGLVAGGGLVGLAVAMAALRWPSRDPSAPALDSSQIHATVHRHPRLRAHLRPRFDPATTTGLALTSAVLTLVAAATVIGVLAAMVRTNGALVHADARVSSWAAQHATTSSTPILRFVSQFGGALVVIPLAVAVAVLESLRARTRAVWAFLLLVVGGQFLLANTIKYFVDRARPTLHQLTGFSGKSFPSGHATAAAATYAAFALLLARRRSLNTKAISAGSAAAIAIIIAGTRVLLGVHWLTDVVAGLVLGWAWFAVCSFAFGGRLLRFGAPGQIAEQAASQQPAPTGIGIP